MATKNQLFMAAHEGHADLVASLIAQGADPNVKVSEGYDHGAFLEGVTPLMVAAASPRSNVETVQALLKGGADPFAVSDGEVTALWYAAGGGTGYPLTESNLADLDEDHPYRNWGGGDANRLRLLLDAGLPANETADNGRTAVGETCTLGDPSRLTLLMERGASVWPAKPTRKQPSLADLGFELPAEMESALAPDPSGYEAFTVPLFLAAKAGSLECVKLILNHGFPADFQVKGENALNYAATTEIAELLLDLGLQAQPGPFGFDAIDEAFDDGHSAVAIAIIRRLKDPAERQRVLNAKLISCAGVRMNPEAVSLLIAEGAEVNRIDKSYSSALHYAAWQGDGNGGRENETVEATLRILLDAGADPNLIANGDAPLHEAAGGDWGSPTSIRVLLEHGAQVDARNKRGETPLMIAASNGDVKSIELLLKAGANPLLALPASKAHLKAWQRIASEPVRKTLKFLQKFKLDKFNSAEEVHTHHQEAYESAKAALMLIEAATQSTKDSPQGGPSDVP